MSPPGINRGDGTLPICAKLLRRKWRNSPAGAMQTTLANPDGSEAAELIIELVAALEKAEKSLCVLADEGVFPRSAPLFHYIRTALAKARSESGQ